MQLLFIAPRPTHQPGPSQACSRPVPAQGKLPADEPEAPAPPAPLSATTAFSGAPGSASPLGHTYCLQVQEQLVMRLTLQVTGGLAHGITYS